MFLNFDLGFALCSLRFALAYYALRIRMGVDYLFGLWTEGFHFIYAPSHLIIPAYGISRNNRPD